MPQSANLHELLQHSSSTRQYFVSLPVQTQITLHGYDAQIHSAAQLRHYAAILENHPLL